MPVTRLRHSRQNPIVAAAAPNPLSSPHSSRGDQLNGIGWGNPWATMILDEDEYITEMTACSDLLVRYLEFATNKGRRTIGGMSATTQIVPWCALGDVWTPAGMRD